MADKRDDSTSALIAEAEALRSGKGDDRKSQSTRSIVREAERAIGRPPSQSSSTPIVLAVAAALAALGAAIYFFL